MKIFNTKVLIAIGIAFILLAIIIGIVAEHDIGFFFAGVGVIIIGIGILRYINKNYISNLENKNNKDE